MKSKPSRHGTAILILSTAASSLWGGWVLMLLWGWFVVPATGLASIGLPLAIGLRFVAFHLTGLRGHFSDYDALQKLDGPMWLNSLVAEILYGALILASGFIAHLWL